MQLVWTTTASLFFHTTLLFCAVTHPTTHRDMGADRVGGLQSLGWVDIGMPSEEHASDDRSSSSTHVDGIEPPHHDKLGHGAVSHRQASSERSGLIGSTPVRSGDWKGTYTCANQLFGLVVRIETLEANRFRLFGSVTGASGLHGAYKQHGTRNTFTGVSTFVPDGWDGPPIPGYSLYGMHGGFLGDAFDGVVDDPSCGSVHLHRDVHS